MPVQVRLPAPKGQTRGLVQIPVSGGTPLQRGGYVRFGGVMVARLFNAFLIRVSFTTSLSKKRVCKDI